MRIEYDLLNRRVRGTKTSVTFSSRWRQLDRLGSCLLALAHRFENLVRSGQVRDYAELARVGHVSRAGLSQILKLMTLAPSVQEYLLSLPSRIPGEDVITARDLRNVLREPRWDRQRTLFELLSRRTDRLPPYSGRY